MEQPIDRGEIDRASLDATERLRARLTGRPAPVAKSRPVLPWVLAAALLTFALGLIANPWFERSVRARLPFSGSVQTADAAQFAALDAKLAALEARARAVPPPGAAMPAERLAATEARVSSTGDQLARDAERIDRLTRDFAALSARVEANSARLGGLADATRTAADRAQAVLTVQLVRRAIDAGRPIGPLDSALRQSFEARYPAAVSAVSVLGAAPVTTASLRRDLETLRRRVTGRAVTASGTGRNWFKALADTVSDVFTADPAPAGGSSAIAPVDGAAAALARGDLTGAAAQLRRLPDRTRGYALGWIAAADRLRAGSEALATLETATALLPPAAPAAVAVAPLATVPAITAVPALPDGPAAVPG